jgi:hypothetical protein
MDAFANEFHKTKYFEDVDYDKIIALEVKVRSIRGIDLYDLVQTTELYLVLNMVVPKNSMYVSYKVHRNLVYCHLPQVLL